METIKFDQAFQLFDAYNSNDPKKISIDEAMVAENLVYAQRMTAKLLEYVPDAPETVQLAARSQHIGRWEIPRKEYPMNRKGYLKWRSQLKIHHAKIASNIMEKAGYGPDAIHEVGNLLLKKNLKRHRDTQILEDVICLVFLEYYFDDFSDAHDEEKLIQILKKTIAKMSKKGVETALNLPFYEKAKALISKASL